MRIVIQKVSEASVTVDQKIVGQIDQGFLLLVGITEQDGPKQVEKLAKKVAGLRIFEDDEGKMNLDIKQVGGRILSVSQFTLYGDASKGNRPSFIKAARPDQALPLYRAFNQALRDLDLEVEEGIFGADMQVSLVNAGPVTIWLDSEEMGII